jgi:hypothetical protein
VAILKGVGKKISQNSGGFLKGVAGAAAGLGGSRKAMGALAIGAFGAGMMSKAGPAAMDATMEGAFGDANADRYFTGRDLSLRTFAGAGIGGLGGEMLQVSSPGDYAATNAMIPPPSGAGVGGSLLGAAAGAAAGGKLAAIKAAKKGAVKGSTLKGKVIGAGLGALTGGMVGAGSAFVGTAQYMKNNRQFFSESPYSPVGSNSMLSASGDIVLGMHNSRRSY